MVPQRRVLVSKYLESVPEGLASYPDVQVKGSVVRAVLTATPIELPRAELPAEVGALVDEPPLPSAWVPEVHLNVLQLAYQERCSAGEWDAWVTASNRAIFEAPLYRVLFPVIGIERIVTGAAKRWSAFRRGTTVDVTLREAKRVELEIRFPEHLYDEALVHSMELAFCALGLVAGARDVVAQAVTVLPTSAQIILAWS